MKILIITSIDFRYRMHQRTHELVRYFSRFHDVTVVNNPSILARLKRGATSTKNILNVILTYLKNPFESLIVTIEGVTIQLIGTKQLFSTEFQVSKLIRPPLNILIHIMQTFYQLFLIISPVMALFACPNPRKYEVCIAEGPWAGVAAIIIKKMGIVKRVVYEDLDFFPAYTFSILKSNFSYHLTYWIEKNAVKRADLVISVGSLLAELRKHQGAKEVHVLSNGYDKRFLDITPDIRSKTIVYAGALANWSGVDKLIEGFRIASTVIPDLQLIIAGDGTEIDTLKNLVKSYGLSEKIKFLGKIPYEDIGHILAKASVGAVIFAPSELTKYAVMCKMMDYLGVGLPILAIDFGETGTFVRNERVGLCVKYDSLSIGENLIRLFKNQRLLIEFHKNAKMAAKGKDWDTILKKEEQLIINLLNFNDK